MTGTALEEGRALQGKVALVTGSSGGLGLSIAEGLAGAGCTVMLHGIEPAETLGPHLATLRALHGVPLEYQRADLAEPESVDRLVRAACELNGGIDILVNNAVTRHFAAIEDFPVRAWDAALAVNLSAAFHTTRLSLADMRRRGWGRIFNMTSVYGMRAAANRIDYVTTKAALIGLTRGVALETVHQGITCNAICPGAVLTPTSERRVDALMLQRGLDREAALQAFLVGKQPTQRFVEASHVADLLVFLCGPAGRDITGAVLPMEGGWLAS